VSGGHEYWLLSQHGFYLVVTNNSIKLEKLHFIIILFLISACESKSYLFPEGTKIQEIDSYYWGTNNVTEFKLDLSSKLLEKLNDFPTKHPGSIIYVSEDVLMKWTKFQDLEKSEKKYIEAIITEIIKWNGLENNKTAKSLIYSIKANENLYFSGHGDKRRKANNDTYNFYEYMYFLNIKSSELIEIANRESNL